MPAVLDGFYDHVANFPEVSRFFRSSEHRKHAKDMQLRHWNIVADARFDQAYVDSVTRIGEVHNKLGLAPTLYIGAYSFLINGICRALFTQDAPVVRSRKWLEHQSALQVAIIKAALLDMDYAISVYIEAGRRDRTKALEDLADTFKSSVGSVSESLGAATEQLKGAATELIGASERTQQDVSSAEQSSSSAASNVQTVASAAEELSCSVQEIGRQVAGSYEISEQAVQNGAEAIETVKSLTAAASKVGEIVGLINDIAGKTNLLALNATIEAARAGDAGKGFAVVAAEVKDLAEQTSNATAEIAAQIEAIQSTTETSAKAMDNVNATINKMNEISATIASAVEEQGAATEEISRNIQEASEGSSGVSDAMAAISGAAQMALDAARQVEAATSDLTVQSKCLRDESSSFLDKVASM